MASGAVWHLSSAGREGALRVAAEVSERGDRVVRCEREGEW